MNSSNTLVAKVATPAANERASREGLLRPALTLFILLSVLTGLAYPLLVTGAAQALMREAARGSLVTRDGRLLGSELIGQSFTRPLYFWSRPSATAPDAYNAAASGGSNLGPTNPALTDAVKARIAALRAADPANTASIPVDLVTASASGLDPHISVAAAQYQVARVAAARAMPPATLQQLIEQQRQSPLLGFLGEPTVNVLRLNMALDEAAKR